VRIALVSPYALDVVGGVQAHVLALADALRRRGDDVVVLGPSSDGPGAASGGAAWGTRSVGRTVAVPANGSRAPVALGPRTAGRVREALRGVAADVVHVHEPLVPVVGPAAVLTAGAPLVLTFHATAEGGSLPVVYRAVRRPARRLVARGDALTAVSPIAAAFHARMLGLDPSTFAVVPNGVDVARFSTAAAAAAAGTSTRLPGPRIVFLGRLEHRKGADIALAAFLRLAERRPDVRLRVLGDGPLRVELARLLATAPPDVAARVELAGRVEPTELPRLLAEADVVTLPSRGGESFGIVLLEAMAARVPIVASDIPGYRAVARPDREALLVAPGDADALAAAVERVLTDTVLADRLRAAGTLRAAEHGWDVVAARTCEVYARARAAAPRRR
jgi:phosphatidyl-myo-inositol alpha-mannosyltransferase